MTFCNFTGRDTSSNMRDCFVAIMEQYGIADKVHAVISDNAINMAKAFSGTFPESLDPNPIMVDDANL